MTKLQFCYFMDYEDGKMARVETTGEYEVPFNVFVDNADQFEDAAEGICFLMDINGVGSDIRFFRDEEEFKASGSNFAVPSMVPMGTFPANADEEGFQESPHILFAGIVKDFAWNLGAGEREPNLGMEIETLDMTVNLYMRYDGPVEKGYVVYGSAWIYGNLEPLDT